MLLAHAGFYASNAAYDRVWCDGYFDDVVGFTVVSYNRTYALEKKICTNRRISTNAITLF